MNLTDNINYVYDQVSKSKFGPIFFDIVDGKVVQVPTYEIGQQFKTNETGQPISLFRMNSISLDVFKICLISYLGIKSNVTATVKEEDSNDEWKKRS